MSTFYIAAHRQDEARALRDDLIKIGHSVSASWLEQTDYQSLSRTDEERTAIAAKDLEDVAKCHALVLIAEPPDKNVPGGKHVETGAALCAGKPIFVVGRRENIFHWHPQVKQCDTKEAFLKAVTGNFTWSHRNQNSVADAVESLLWRAGRELIQHVHAVDLSKKDQILMVTVGSEDNPPTQSDIEGVQQMLSVLCGDTGIRGAVVNGGITMSAIDRKKLLELIDTSPPNDTKPFELSGPKMTGGFPANP